jgi:hypothetical protein
MGLLWLTSALAAGACVSLAVHLVLMRGERGRAWAGVGVLVAAILASFAGSRTGWGVPAQVLADGQALWVANEGGAGGLRPLLVLEPVALVLVGLAVGAVLIRLVWRGGASRAWLTRLATLSALGALVWLGLGALGPSLDAESLRAAAGVSNDDVLVPNPAASGHLDLMTLSLGGGGGPVRGFDRGRVAKRARVVGVAAAKTAPGPTPADWMCSGRSRWGCC